MSVHAPSGSEGHSHSSGGMLSTIGGIFAKTAGSAMSCLSSAADGFMRGWMGGASGASHDSHHDHH